MIFRLRMRCALLATGALVAGMATPTYAQSDADAPAVGAGNNDIVVTAQRVEQRLQDVPISITVLDQAKIANNNISNLKDIATYTPGLAVNNRYGADNTVFTIRGFYQEQRTFSTVGVFFADVVAPRGSGASFGGDGAGPGALFDLQNVQVLKGPQGTLFGRNVTGGAVLLVPRKPTDKVEGYVEGSAGNYDMWRTQGVLNLPLSDTFRIRAGFDHMQRDGYLRNIGRFGDGKYGNHGMGDVDYWAGRVSIVGDLTPNLENYTIVSYTHSQSNGVIPKVIRAFPTVAGTTTPTFFGAGSQAQIDRERAYGFYTVSNRLPDSASKNETRQIINTTTWQASDSLTVKNILSYGEFRGVTNLELFGNYAIANGVRPGTETPGQVTGFAFTHAEPVNGYTNAQSSFVEELQLQGRPGDGRFTWQAGAYAEINNPLGFSGVQTALFNGCDDIVALNCTPGSTGSLSLSSTKFRDYAVYGQASYSFTDKLKLTLGGRYTWDKVSTKLINETVLFGRPANVDTARFRCTNLTAPDFVQPNAQGQFTPDRYTFTYAQRFNVCQQNLRQSTSAPTWLVDLDYKPVDNVLVFAKWARGYRQGGLAIFGPDPIQPYKAEAVDDFELGTKTSWRGAMPGNFNVTLFYNNFRNQQLQLGVTCVPGLPGFTGLCGSNAGIINAGKSRMYGAEVDAGISPFEGLRIDVGYSYLNARILKVIVPAPGSLPPYNSFAAPLAKPCGGPFCDQIANSGPPHKVVLSAAYTLPFADSVGRVSLGGTFVYQSRYRIVADGVVTVVNGLPVTSGAGIAPSSSVLNLNLNWQEAAGLPIDASVFVTNLTNERVVQQINDNQLRGFISASYGEPRIWGVRLRYRFGDR